VSTDRIETYRPFHLNDAAYTPPRIAKCFLAHVSIHKQPESADSAVQDMLDEITTERRGGGRRADLPLKLSRSHQKKILDPLYLFRGSLSGARVCHISLVR